MAVTLLPVKSHWGEQCSDKVPEIRRKGIHEPHQNHIAQILIFFTAKGWKQRVEVEKIRGLESREAVENKIDGGQSARSWPVHRLRRMRCQNSQVEQSGSSDQPILPVTIRPFGGQCQGNELQLTGWLFLQHDHDHIHWEGVQCLCLQERAHVGSKVQEREETQDSLFFPDQYPLYRRVQRRRTRVLEPRVQKMEA